MSHNDHVRDTLAQDKQKENCEWRRERNLEAHADGKGATNVWKSKRAASHSLSAIKLFDLTCRSHHV